MSLEQCEAAIQIGIDSVRDLKEKGYDILATGEMGIGNTTPSSALAAVLLEQEVETVTGKGAGLSNSSLELKIDAIKRAIKRYHSSEIKSIKKEAMEQEYITHSSIIKNESEIDPMEQCSLNKDTIKISDSISAVNLLSQLGGYDIAGLVGVFLGGAIYKLPIVIDGFISSVAALLAVKIEPKARFYMFASHESKEPAGRMVLEALQMKPFITCDMYLGEGTGAIAVLPIFNMATQVYEKMSTFKEIEIEDYKRF